MYLFLVNFFPAEWSMTAEDVLPSASDPGVQEWLPSGSPAHCRHRPGAPTFCGVDSTTDQWVVLEGSSPDRWPACQDDTAGLHPSLRGVGQEGPIKNLDSNHWKHLSHSSACGFPDCLVGAPLLRLFLRGRSLFSWRKASSSPSDHLLLPGRRQPVHFWAPSEELGASSGGAAQTPPCAQKRWRRSLPLEGPESGHGSVSVRGQVPHHRLWRLH